MSDTAATLAHQLALVNEAQLEESAEESNALRRQLAASELKMQKDRRNPTVGEQGFDELPVPEKVPTTHDKPCPFKKTMNDTTATLAHQLALVKAQLEKNTEESNALKTVVQQLRERLSELPAPEKPPPTHDNPSFSATGSELATSTAGGLAAALLSHSGIKGTPVPLPRADEVARGAGSYFFAAQDSARDLGRDEEPLSGLRAAAEYQDPNAPLLFPGEQKHASRKKKTPKAKGKHFIRASRRMAFAMPPTENMMKTRYPMFVLPVKVLLSLERLLPHQDMLKQGLLLPYNQFSMKGRIMFISHQCTSPL